MLLQSHLNTSKLYKWTEEVKYSQQPNCQWTSHNKQRLKIMNTDKKSCLLLLSPADHKLPTSSIEETEEDDTIPKEYRKLY